MIRLMSVLLFFCISFSARSQNENTEKNTETVTGILKRKIDPDKLNHFSWVYSGDNIKTECKGFICNYKDVNEPVIRINPFPPETILKDTSLFSFTPAFYKEVEEEKIQHGRMLYKAKNIRLFISGYSSRYFLIDTLRKGYLLQVSHANGLESWYYPVYNPPVKMNVQNPGEQIGVSSGSYFWQLRFRNRSFLVSGLIDKNFVPDDKGVFIENINLPIIPVTVRYRGFITGLKNNLKETEQKQNFSDDFNKQMDEKQ